MSAEGTGAHLVGDGLRLGRDAAEAKPPWLKVRLRSSARLDETRDLVGLHELSLMKPTAYLINTARGGIIDEAALYQALKTEVIAGAGIDPFVIEPAPTDHPLLALPNILLSPHSAGVSEESIYRMGYNAAKNVVDCFDGPATVHAHSIHLSHLGVDLVKNLGAQGNNAHRSAVRGANCHNRATSR